MSMKQDPRWDQHNGPSVPSSFLFQSEWLHLVPSAIYTCDTDGYILFSNRAAHDLWGRVPMNGIDRWIGAYRLLQANGAPVAIEETEMAMAIRSGSALAGAEYIIVRPDGSKLQVRCQVNPIRDEAGKWAGSICTLEEMTALKEARALQQQMEDHT